jgi:hypothetical protein
MSRSKNTLPLAAMLFTLVVAQPALAQEPAFAGQDRALLKEAQGEYQLDDGRTLKVKVGETRLRVGVDAESDERWHAEGADLLVSADGRRRVRLIRNSDGSVDRIAFETDRAVR